MFDEVPADDIEYRDDDVETFLREFNEHLVVSEPVAAEEDDITNTV